MAYAKQWAADPGGNDGTDARAVARLRLVGLVATPIGLWWVLAELGWLILHGG